MFQRFLVGALLLAALFTAGFAVWNYVKRSGSPHMGDLNVLLISLDTTRADFFGCYGNAAVSTPAMDALAAEGVLFENFYTNINATLPANSTIMTGLYPANHGVARNSMRLGDQNLTLAEFFAANGYKTAAFIGSFILSSTFGFHQGFHTFDEKFKINPSSYVEHRIKTSTKESQMIVHENNIRQITRKAEEVNDSFFKWLDQNKNQKFFAFLHYYDPHFPYSPPDEWRKKHLPSIPNGVPMTQPARNPLEKTFQGLINPELIFRSSEIHTGKYEEQIDALLKLYLAEVEYTDYAIGKVIERLETLNLREKTILIVTADHGENLVEHWEMNQFFRHGTLTFESEARVPFIISLPGVLQSGKRVDQNASHIDIFPTLTSLIGAESPSRTDGTSLVADLSGRRSSLQRPVFTEACMPYLDWQIEASNVGWLNQRNSASMRLGDYKYVNMPLRNYEAVFNLRSDRTEEQNLLHELRQTKPGLLTALRNGMQKWRQTISTGQIDTAFQLSEEDQEKLEALGYIQ